MVFINFILIIPLYIIQEASGKLGAVSGKGLGELIRFRFSQKTAIVALTPIFLADMFSYIAEYLGIMIAGLIFGVPPFITLPLFFIIHIIIVIKNAYYYIERVLIVISFVLIFTFLAQTLMRGVIPQSTFYVSTDHDFILFLAANVGATVMPFMPLYQCSATAYKYSNLKVNLQDKLKWVSIETFFGALISQTVMIIIEMGSTGLGNLDPLMNYKEFAAALSTIAGNFSPYIFSLGLISAGLLSLVVISLGSAWGFLEAIGKNDKLNFIKIYSIESIPAFILICLLNNQDIIVSMLEVLSIFPIIVSIPSILIGILISDEKIMGKHKYDGFRLILYWIMVIIVLACGIVSLIK